MARRLPRALPVLKFLQRIEVFGQLCAKTSWNFKMSISTKVSNELPSELGREVLTDHGSDAA